MVLHAYEKDPISLIIDSSEYREMLIVKKQLALIRSKLDAKHLVFFNERLLKKKLPEWGDAEGWKLYKDIFRVWQRVYFSRGKKDIYELDPVLLGGELKRLRVIRGIFVKQAAELVGVSPRAMYAYEDGTREMKASTLYKLCQIYKVTMDEVAESSTKNVKKQK